MHDDARDFCQEVALTFNWKHTNSAYGLDIGGANVNGTCRKLWPHLDWTVIDPKPLERSLAAEFASAYIQRDATKWTPDREYDLVLCTEVLEHCQEWPNILDTASIALKSGGILVITCAAPGRRPHSAIDGGHLRAGEYYRNISAEELGDQLYFRGFQGNPIYNPVANDTYVRAIKN